MYIQKLLPVFLRPVGWFNVSLTELNIANFIIAEDFLYSVILQIQ